MRSGPNSIRTTTRTLAAAIPVGASCCLLTQAMAQVDPATGIEFVTVGAVGNAPWACNGTPGDRAIGRGTVNYDYRIGKYEVKSDEWAEFYTAALDRPAGDAIPHVTTPFTTGGFAEPWRGTGGIT